MAEHNVNILRAVMRLETLRKVMVLPLKGVGCMGSLFGLHTSAIGDETSFVNEGPTLTRRALRWHGTSRRHLQETDESNQAFYFFETEEVLYQNVGNMFYDFT